MRIRWTVPAASDLESIKNYLLQHYPQFAEPTVRTIYQRIRSLKTSPNWADPGIASVQENWGSATSLRGGLFGQS